ncbi:MAG: fluoride efflux transporter CrcB [Chloroflexi bacterium]|nr:fluoride efflux transporter CrcB [Chloroflexota bacterium]
MMNVVYLAIGGAAGTLSRYYVTGRVADWSGGTAGLGVFAVNIIGSFIIGLFLTLSEERFMWPSQLRLLIAVGFLGAFTTFSSLTWETLQMLELRDVAAASLNIGGSVVCGLLAVYLGSVLGRAI